MANCSKTHHITIVYALIIEQKLLDADKKFYMDTKFVPLPIKYPKHNSHHWRSLQKEVGLIWKMQSKSQEEYHYQHAADYILGAGAQF